MKLINATCPGFDKVVLRSPPGLTSMQECAKDGNRGVGKVTWTLQTLIDALRAYEKKSQGIFDKINEKRYSSKMIRFYVASVDSADIPDVASFVQEEQVTKSDLKQLKIPQTLTSQETQAMEGNVSVEWTQGSAEVALWSWQQRWQRLEELPKELRIGEVCWQQRLPSRIWHQSLLHL